MINSYLVQQIKGNFLYKPTLEQEKAVKFLADFLFSRQSDSVFLLKGYAGTGKTSLIGALVKTLDQLQQKCVLLAPTGRAAKVFSHYAQHPAYTIHKKIYRQRNFSNDLDNFSLNDNLHQHTLFIVDGAHNPAAADMLEDSVRKYFKGRKMYFIMGVFRDKDYSYIIRKLCPYAEQIVTIETPHNPRALPAQELAEAVRACNPHVQAAENIQDAVNKVFAMAEREDLILSFGSLSFIGEITTLVKNREEKNL